LWDDPHNDGHCEMTHTMMVIVRISTQWWSLWDDQKMMVIVSLSWTLALRACPAVYKTQHINYCQALKMPWNCCVSCARCSCVVLWKFVRESCRYWTVLTVCTVSRCGHNDNSLRGVALISALLLIKVCLCFHSTEP